MEETKQPANLPRRRNTRQNNSLKSECLPLDQAAKIEMAAMPSKTPVSILQELLNRRGFAPPKYQLFQIEGVSHEPVFRYRVNVEGLIGMGLGCSKQAAKHAAAKSLLDMLIEHQYIECQYEDDSEMCLPTKESLPENPIGSLQEMCVSRRWPPPLYEMEQVEGLPHKRQFTIVCEVFRYRELGTGKSKKLAKRQAALKMWQYLQELRK